MPQNPLAATVAVNPSGVQQPLHMGAVGDLMVATGKSTSLNIAAQTVVKTGAGRIAKLIVNTAGSTGGTVSDAATTGAVAASNLIFNIPNTVGIYNLDFPFTAGLVITTGTSQVVSISYV